MKNLLEESDFDSSDPDSSETALAAERPADAGIEEDHSDWLMIKEF